METYSSQHSYKAVAWPGQCPRPALTCGKPAPTTAPLWIIGPSFPTKRPEKTGLMRQHSLTLPLPCWQCQERSAHHSHTMAQRPGPSLQLLPFPSRWSKVLTPGPTIPQMFVKTCTDLALQLGGTIPRQLLQGLWTLHITLPCYLEHNLPQAAPDKVFWRILRSSWTQP